MYTADWQIQKLLILPTIQHGDEQMKSKVVLSQTRTFVSGVYSTEQKQSIDMMEE